MLWSEVIHIVIHTNTLVCAKLSFSFLQAVLCILLEGEHVLMVVPAWRSILTTLGWLLTETLSAKAAVQAKKQGPVHPVYEDQAYVCKDIPLE